MGTHDSIVLIGLLRTKRGRERASLAPVKCKCMVVIVLSLEWFCVCCTVSVHCQLEGSASNLQGVWSQRAGQVQAGIPAVEGHLRGWVGISSLGDTLSNGWVGGSMPLRY